jgi:hypothetical protein
MALVYLTEDGLDRLGSITMIAHLSRSSIISGDREGI